MPQESLGWHAAPGSNGPLPLRFHLVRCNRADATGIPRSAFRMPKNFVPDARYAWLPDAGLPGAGRRAYAIT